MSHLNRALLSIALAAAAALAVAQSGAQTAPKPASGASQALIRGADYTAAWEAQMKSMREMHEKMANARTPEERNALMAEHMKLMQGGMATMNMMGGPGAHGMGGMGGMQGTRPAPGNMGQRQQMMERRMDMMQSMMQMMMDRMPPAPAK